MQVIKTTREKLEGHQAGTMVDWIAFSVDLEPNKDGTLDGITEAMDWFDDTIPRGTVYATHRIATELPEVIADLAVDHEIGVHVHPREFGHDHDQFAELNRESQCELIAETRTALSEAAGINETEVVAFRAGRHSASETTFQVLANLGFNVDASINVRYADYLPESLTKSKQPFKHSSGLLQIPTTWICPSLLSPVGWRIFPNRTLTATANTLRSDSISCSGERAIRTIFARSPIVSMYMHPYDATDYQSDLTNNGERFRQRLEDILTEYSESKFVTASEIKCRLG